MGLFRRAPDEQDDVLSPRVGRCGRLRYLRVLGAFALLLFLTASPADDNSPSFLSAVSFLAPFPPPGHSLRQTASNERALADPYASDPSVQSPWLVYVLLGTPHHQVWTLDSVRQARLLNPEARLMLVHTDELFADRYDWIPELEDLGVQLVNFTAIKDSWYDEFAANYERVWKEGGHGMIPTVNDGTGRGRSNENFAALTMERLAALHRAMKVHDLVDVIHVENDQMLYGRLGRVVRAAKECGVKLAMTRVGSTKMAPAVVYAADADALFDMLDYINRVLAHGAGHAAEVSKSTWVTDMSLTMAYFNMHEEMAEEAAQRAWEEAAAKEAEKNHEQDRRGEEGEPLIAVEVDDGGGSGSSSTGVVSFPNHADTSCLWDKLHTVFDAAALGVWCCGSMGEPHKLFKSRLDSSGVAYWDAPFTWVQEPAGADVAAAFRAAPYASSWRAQMEEREGLASDAADAGGDPDGPDSPLLLRRPHWDGHAVFNLHMHNKQLWRWSSLRNDSGIL